jgi:hypothetical protein
MNFKNLWDWLLGLLHLDRKTRETRAALNEEIERLVQEVSPAIRNVSGYRKELRLPLETAKAYIEEMGAAVPGPLPLSIAGWGQCSPAELLFINVDQARDLLRESTDLQAFFQQDPAPRAVALLTATCHEKTIFGVEMQGEILRRDVPQQAVDFTDHRIVVPAATEALNRQAVRQGALHLLALRALEHLTNLKTHIEDLNEERRSTELKLKVLLAHNRSLEGLLESDRESAGKAARVREMLSEINQELDTVKAALGRPEDGLKHLVTFLNYPDQVLTFHRLNLRLNWMGVKVHESAADPGKEIPLIEVEIKDRLKRVATLISIDREEVVSQS